MEEKKFCRDCGSVFKTSIQTKRVCDKCLEVMMENLKELLFYVNSFDHDGYVHTMSEEYYEKSDRPQLRFCTDYWTLSK